MEAAKLRWAGGARSAQLGVAMSPKRQVRAAHGRARAAKTHYLSYIYLGYFVCLCVIVCVCVSQLRNALLFF